MKRRLLLGLIILLAVAFSVVGRQQSWAQNENTRVITVHIEGVTKTVATNAGTVEDALDRLNVRLNQNDKTEPGLNQKIQGNDYTINVYRARPITVVDGANTYSVLTAQRSGRAIAKEAGFTTDQEDQFAFEKSDNPNTATPATQMVIKRSKNITFSLYGTSSPLRTHENTVAGLLRERDITLEDGDEVNVPLATKITEGMTVSLDKVNRNSETVEEVAPFAEEQVRDAQQPTTYRKVQSPGKNGKKLVTYETVSKNGGAPVRTAVKEVITERPVNQIVIVGAKSNQFSGDFGAALARLRSCEGAYTSNTGNGYYGAYQFNLGTWRSNAPAAYKDVLPSSAPPGVQDEAAANLYKARGWQPWPGCTKKLGLQDIYR